MTAITRSKIRACGTVGCPWRDDEDAHRNFCGHFRPVTHQHYPKKGMGGHNALSKIVALLCWWCHDKIDNWSGWGNKVEDGVYTAWNRNGVFIERQVTA